MAGQRIATLEIGFEIATGNLSLEAARTTGAVDTMTANVLRSLERIDQRTGTLGDMREPIKGINRYGAAVETNAISIQREKNRIESAGERMVSQLERETAAFGKSSGELRNMRVALTAAAAESQGMTELAARLRMASIEMDRLENSTTGMTKSAGLNRMQIMTAQSAVMRFGDAVISGMSPLKAFALEAHKGVEVMSMDSGGFAGGLFKVAGMALALAAPLSVAGVAVKRWQDDLNDSAGLEAYAKQLGLTEKEVDKLGGTTVTVGDMLHGLWKTIADELESSFGKSGKRLVDYLYSPTDMKQIEGFVASIYGTFAGAYDSIVQLWSHVSGTISASVSSAAQAAAGFFKPVVDGATWVWQSVSEVFEKLYGLAAGWLRGLGSWIAPVLKAIGMSGSADAVGSAGGKIGQVFGDAYAARVKQAMSGMDSFINSAGVNAVQAARDRLGDGAADKTKKLNDDAAREAARAAEELERNLRSLEGDFDPAAKAARDYADALDDIYRAEKAGILSGDKVSQYLMAAAERYGAAVRKVQDATTAPLTIAPKLNLDIPEIHFDIDPINLQIQQQIELWNKLDKQVQDTAAHMRDAFGHVGGAIGDALAALSRYGKEQQEIEKARQAAGVTQEQLDALAKRSADNQLNSAISLTGALKGLFKDHSAGYRAMEAAEKALTIVQLARTAVAVAEGAAQMFASAGPAGFPLVAAMLGTMAAVGFASAGGGGRAPAASNTGTGTVLGDPDAKSDSIKNAIGLLHDVDDATLSVSRDMLTSLRAIQNNIGGLAGLLVKTGNLDASAGVNQGFSTDALGKTLSYVATGGILGVVLKKIPVIGDILGGIGKVIQSLFGTKTTVVGSGLYGGDQSLGNILSGGYDLQTYSDIQKKKKFFGITTGTSYSTQYGQTDQSIDDQFTLVLRSFYTAISKAAPELGRATSDVEQQLNGFVFSLGKIDIAGKTGTEIQELLENALGAAADKMASAAFPGLDRFQRVGEGMFETITRVATTVEQVDAVFLKLGMTASSMGIDVDMAVASMFDNVSDFTSVATTYFSDYYSKQEQAAANTAQLTRALGSLGLQLPDTLADYRKLVEAQDLSTDSGRQMYVTLLQLAPAFSDLKTSLEGAKSAADILSEREDLNTKLLQLTGDTAALRAAELAKLDPSNRALQQQIYAIQDAQDAAKAADDLRQAWQSVGDSIMTEVQRIRGLTDASSGGSFASLLGQFNAATANARAGDQDAAKLLPGLSQSLLTAAQAQATSRQELDRIQAQTAASLEATFGAITALTSAATSTTSPLDVAAATSAATTQPANDDSTASEIAGLRADMADMSAKLTAALATIAGYTGRTAKKLDDVTGQSGGDAISIVQAAA